MIETDMSKYEDFIEIYDNVVSPDFCQRTIAHYEALVRTRKAYSRQETDLLPKADKDGWVGFLTDDPNIQHFMTPSDILEEFHYASSECYKHYADKIGILGSMKCSMNHNVQLQKTPRTGGYHMWHCEHGKHNWRRAVFVQLYLNTIEEGGETEFLYQSKRINAVAGRIVMCPAGYTHTHRGNPPLSGDKYTLNSWIEYQD